MKKSELRKIIRESIKEAMLNEGIPCQCFAGGQVMTCYTMNDYGACCDHYYVRNTKCCSVQNGGVNHRPHAMCNDRPCGSLDNTTCFDVGGMTTGPGGPGLDPTLEPEIPLDDTQLDFPLVFKPIKTRVKSKMPQIGYEVDRFNKPTVDKRNILNRR